jgi:hypothetical protein
VAGTGALYLSSSVNIAACLANLSACAAMVEGQLKTNMLGTGTTSHDGWAITMVRCHRNLRYQEARTAEDSRWRPQPCDLALNSSSVGTPIAAFRRSIAQPADAPVRASMGPSRYPPQDLGSG